MNVILKKCKVQTKKERAMEELEKRLGKAEGELEILSHFFGVIIDLVMQSKDEELKKEVKEIIEE